MNDSVYETSIDMFFEKGYLRVKKTLPKEHILFLLCNILEELFSGKQVQNSGCLWKVPQRLSGKRLEGTLSHGDYVLYFGKHLSYTGVCILVHFTGGKFCLKTL